MPMAHTLVSIRSYHDDNSLTSEANRMARILQYMTSCDGPAEDGNDMRSLSLAVRSDVMAANHDDMSCS